MKILKLWEMKKYEKNEDYERKNENFKIKKNEKK